MASLPPPIEMARELVQYGREFAPPPLRDRLGYMRPEDLVERIQPLVLVAAWETMRKKRSARALGHRNDSK